MHGRHLHRHEPRRGAAGITCVNTVTHSPELPVKRGKKAQSLMRPIRQALNLLLSSSQPLCVQGYTIDAHHPLRPWSVRVQLRPEHKPTTDRKALLAILAKWARNAGRSSGMSSAPLCTIDEPTPTVEPKPATEPSSKPEQPSRRAKPKKPTKAVEPKQRLGPPRRRKAPEATPATSPATRPNRKLPRTPEAVVAYAERMAKLHMERASRKSGSLCSQCGEYLRTSCYSKNPDAKRVPRTAKLCGSCFRMLDPKEQEHYCEYRYGTYNPKATGWNPERR